MELEQNNSYISDFKLSESNSKASSCNSKKSKIGEISNISDFDSLREELYTIEELKDNAKQKNYEEAMNLYDLDEKRNMIYISQFFERKDKEDKEKINQFNNMQYKLSYEDRISLLNKYKYLLRLC